MPSIHVITALPMEANALRRALKKSGFQNIRVTAVGIRAVRLNDIPPWVGETTVIVAGLAGGLDPSLRIGDVVLDAPQSIVSPPGVARGRMHTSPHLLDSIDHKAALFARTGAAAVDMEQAIVADRARPHPVIGLRAISDAATDALDPILLQMVDALGRPRPALIADALLRKPARIVAMLRLARRSNLALANLSAALVDLVKQLH